MSGEAAQYDYTLSARQNGQVLSAQSDEVSLVNPITAQVSTATVGGTTDGVYTLQVVGPQGTWSWSYTASSNTAAQIATAIEAVADADDTFKGIGTVEDSTADVVITFLDARSEYTVTWTADASGASTVATTTAAGGTVCPYGVVVALTLDGKLTRPGSLQATDLIGVVVRGTESQVTNGSTTPTEGVQPGQVARVIKRGIVACKVGTAVLPDDSADYRSSSGTTDIPVGTLGNSALPSGTAVPNGSVRFLTTTGAQGIAAVAVNFT